MIRDFIETMAPRPCLIKAESGVSCLQGKNLTARDPQKVLRCQPKDGIGRAGRGPDFGDWRRSPSPGSGGHSFDITRDYCASSRERRVAAAMALVISGCNPSVAIST